MTAVPYRLDPAHAALIVVDVQNDFCDPQGSLGRIGLDVAAAGAMVPRLEKLIDVARAAVAHENTVGVVRRNFGTVVTSDEVATVWSRVPVTV